MKGKQLFIIITGIFIILPGLILANEATLEENSLRAKAQELALQESAQSAEIPQPKEIKNTEINKEDTEIKPRCLEAIEFLTGFGWGKLQHRDNYNLYPFMVDFDLNLKPLIGKIGLHPRSLVQFQIEPFANFISSPKSNAEVGTAFLFKVGALPQTSKFQPYIKAGVGMVYMSLATSEQSTKFNFIEQGGMGFHYFFRKNTAFTFEGRIRHLSNAGIDQPNHGINTYFLLSGISYQF